MYTLSNHIVIVSFVILLVNIRTMKNDFKKNTQNFLFYWILNAFSLASGMEFFVFLCSLSFKMNIEVFLWRYPYIHTEIFKAFSHRKAQRFSIHFILMCVCVCVRINIKFKAIPSGYFWCLNRCLGPCQSFFKELNNLLRKYLKCGISNTNTHRHTVRTVRTTWGRVTRELLVLLFLFFLTFWLFMTDIRVPKQHLTETGSFQSEKLNEFPLFSSFMDHFRWSWI